MRRASRVISAHFSRTLPIKVFVAHGHAVQPRLAAAEQYREG
jgi:hypothetical protein